MRRGVLLLWSKLMSWMGLRGGILVFLLQSMIIIQIQIQNINDYYTISHQHFNQAADLCEVRMSWKKSCSSRVIIAWGAILE